MRTRTPVLLASLASFVGMAHAQTPARFVDASAASGGSGLSWSSPYNDLQDALNDMPGLLPVNRVIFVAIGDYTPSAQSDPLDARTARFSIPQGTQLYGGFLNGQTLLNREERFRDTELSGDLGSSMTTSDNAYNVVVVEAGTEEVRIDGFAIRNGNANHPSLSQFQSGAGIRCVGNDLRVENVFAELNVAAEEGGAIYHSGVATFSLNSFRMHRSFIGNNRAGLRGGGVYLQYTKPPALAGIHGPEPSWIFNTSFYRNLAGTLNHPQISFNGGAAIFMDWCGGGGPPLNTYSNVGMLVMNCQMHDNAVYGGGAAVRLTNAGTAQHTLWTNNTMAYNRVLQGPGNGYDGGTFYTEGSTSPQPVLTNSIVYDTFDSTGNLNTIEAVDGSGSQSANPSVPATAATEARRCDIYTPAAGTYPGTGGANFDTAPGFIDGPGRNFQLAASSPMIDEGITSNLSLPFDYPDMDGVPTPLQLTPYFIYTGPANLRAVSLGGPFDVDIGAFERQF